MFRVNHLVIIFSFSTGIQTNLLTYSFKIMFNLFKKKTEKEKLQEKYKKLLEESYKLSHSNRAASDKKVAEAEAIFKKIEAMDQK